MKVKTERGFTTTKLLIIVAAICGVLFVFTVAYGLLFRDTRTLDRKTADAFMTALAKDDSSTTYNMFTKHLRSQLSKSIWVADVDSSFKNYHGKPKYLSSTSVANPKFTYPADTDPIMYTYQFNFSGKLYNMTIVLLKESAVAWQIDEWSTTLQ